MGKKTSIYNRDSAMLSPYVQKKAKGWEQEDVKPQETKTVKSPAPKAAQGSIYEKNTDTFSPGTQSIIKKGETIEKVSTGARKTYVAKKAAEQRYTSASGLLSRESDKGMLLPKIDRKEMVDGSAHSSEAFEKKANKAAVESYGRYLRGEKKEKEEKPTGKKLLSDSTRNMLRDRVGDPDEAFDISMKKGEDLTWVQKRIEDSGSSSWSEYLTKVTQEDADALDEVDVSAMGILGRSYYYDVKSAARKNTARKDMDEASKTLGEVKIEEDYYVHVLAKERAKELEGVKAEDYVYTPYARSGEDEEFSAYMAGIYERAEAEALRQVYTAEELEVIDKNIIDKNGGRWNYVFDYAKKGAKESADVLKATVDVATRRKNPVQAIAAYVSDRNKTDKSSVDTGRIKTTQGIVNEAQKLKQADAAVLLKENEDWEAKSVLPQEDTEKVLYQHLYDADTLINLSKRAGRATPFNEEELRAMNYATEEEKKVIAYLWRTSENEKERTEDIKSYIDAIKGDALKRWSSAYDDESKKYAREHPVLAHGKMALNSAESGVQGVVDAVTDPIEVLATGKDEPYDVNSPRWKREVFKEVVMDTTKKDKFGDFGDFLYDTAVSVGDNLIRVGTASVIGKTFGIPGNVAAEYISPVLMAGGVYDSAMYDALSRGADNNTARAFGITAAAVEQITESMGMEAVGEAVTNIVAKGGKGITRELISSAFSNVGEELAAYLGKLVYDDMLMGENSTYNQRLKEYKEAGEDEKTATWYAIRDTAIGAFSAAAGGFISGGAMTGVGAAKNAGMKKIAVSEIKKSGKRATEFLKEQTEWNDTTEKVFNENYTALDEAEQVTSSEKGKNKINAVKEGLETAATELRNKSATETTAKVGEEVPDGDSPSVSEADSSAPSTIEDGPPPSEREAGSSLTRGVDITVNKLAEGAWSEEKEAIYNKTVKSLEDMVATATDENAQKNIQAEIDRVKDVYVSSRFGNVMSIDAAIAKVKGEEEKLRNLWSKGRTGQEADADIETQILTANKKRASLEKLKAFNDAGFNVKYFSNADSDINGVIIGNNVYVNMDGKEAVKHTVGHEFGHMLKNANIDAWNSYVNAVKKTIDESAKEKLFEEYTAKYGETYQNWNEDMFWEEYAADVAGDLLQDVTYGKSLINAIVSENATNDVKRSKLRTIGEVLQNLIRKIQVAWRKHTGTYKMGEAASYVSNLVEVHKELLRAYRSLESNKKNASGADDGIKYSVEKDEYLTETDKKEVSYAELVKKPDMIVTKLINMVPYKQNGKIDGAEVARISKENAKSKNNPKNTDNEIFVYVKDADKNIKISMQGLRHGLTRKSEATAMVTMQIGDLLENAILVNKLLPRNGTLGGDVFIGIGVDTNGKYYPTRIKSVDRRITKVEVLGILDGIKAQKKDQSPNGAGSSAKANSLSKGPTITIADLLDIVKDVYGDILSEDVLKNYNMTRPKSSLSDSVKFSVSSPDTEARSTVENRAYEIEMAVSDRLSEMLEVRLTDATRDAVKVYALSSAMGDEARIRASLEKLTDSIIRNEAPVLEVQAEDDGFLEMLRGVKKVYVSAYARQEMPVSDLNKTFGIGRWSGKEGLPVDVLYDNMKAGGITLSEADTIQDKLIAIKERKAELTEVRREALPRDEVRSIVDYAVDLSDYKANKISEDVSIPKAGRESRVVLDEEFKSKRRALQEEIKNLPEDAYEERFRLTQEKNELEKDFVEGYIAHGKGKSVRDIAMDFCTMNEAEEQIARAKLKRSEDAVREARGYARENGMTQAMTSAARAMAEGNMTESELNTKYRNASDRVKIMELSELYKRVTYTTQNLKAEQRATLYEVCDVLFKNASYMRDLNVGHGQIDTFESLVNYICRVDSFKDSTYSNKVPEDVRRELVWAAKQLNDIFYYSIQDNTDGMNQWKDKYKEKLSELGIGKRSAESAAAQALGEGFWNEDDLIRANFDSEQREKIKELAGFLKNMYKEILPEINKIRFAQGEGDISAPTFKVDKTLKNEITKMHWMVEWIKQNSKAIDGLKASEVKQFAEKNKLRVEAVEAYRTYGKSEFAKHINWRYSNAQGRSEGDMAQWAWNLIQDGKRYDRSRGTIEMDYFPHLEKDDNQSTVLQFLNIKKTIDKLPTAISGMTENFKPNKKWSPFMQERLGNETEWDAMTGAERYLDSIGMYMYHASDITKVRILENYIREAYGSNSGDKYVLSNFAQYLRQYGDDLAGKQHKIDRALQETFVGRRLAQWWRALMTSISRNQLGANISTTITNSALYGQGVSWVVRETIYEGDLSNLIKIFNTGMGKSKDYIEKSTFLKNRFHDDIQFLDKSRAINVIAKINNGMFKPMQMVDMVATTRVHKMMTAVYMNQGMSEADAIENADIALRQLAASREYGEKPLIFSSNTASIVTKYTLEPLNQMRYYKNQFTRMTQAIMDESDTKTKAVVKAAGMMMLAVAADALIMHLMNCLFKKLKGYPVVMDPVQMAIDTWGNIKEGDISGAWLDVIDEVPIANNIIKAMQGEVTDMIVIGNLIDFLGGVCSIPSGKVNWEEFLWNAGMMFNPLGGTAQAKKMVQACKFLSKGYQEKDGKVQYATDATAWDWAVGMMFGKSAIPSVQEWYDNGYKSLSKSNSNAFKQVLDLYPVSPEDAFDMMMEFQDKCTEAKESDSSYSSYEWVTQELGKWDGYKWSTYDKYFISCLIDGREATIPERMESPEKIIAEMYIRTGDSTYLMQSAPDTFTIKGADAKAVYTMNEEHQELYQAEYQRALFKEISAWTFGKDFRTIWTEEQWADNISEAKTMARDAAASYCLANNYYESSHEEEIPPEPNTFESLKNNDELTDDEKFAAYIKKEGRDYVVYNESYDAGWNVMRDTFMVEGDTAVLPAKKDRTFDQSKKRYHLNDEQYAKFVEYYNDAFYDEVAGYENYTYEQRRNLIKKAKTKAHDVAKAKILREYKGEIVITDVK